MNNRELWKAAHQPKTPARMISINGIEHVAPVDVKSANRTLPNLTIGDDCYYFRSLMERDAVHDALTTLLTGDENVR